MELWWDAAQMARWVFAPVQTTKTGRGCAFLHMDVSLSSQSSIVAVSCIIVRTLPRPL
jgi:hypothetical protein